MRRAPLIPREREIQRAVVRLFELAGGFVWEAGRPRSRADRDPGMRQTPGLPDLPLVFFPGIRQVVVVECKRPGERLGLAQQVVADLCAACRLTHLVIHSVEEAQQWLREQGVIRADGTLHPVFAHPDGPRWRQLLARARAEALGRARARRRAR